MLESLFGAETPLAVRVIIALVVVFALIGLVFWLIRRFGSGALGHGARGRAPRLAVIESGAVDGRRTLVLIRRDNIEHLIMIGGPTDIVIEPNIVRGQNAGREMPPARGTGAADALPRAVPLGDEGNWPLQPEPAPRPARPARPAPTAEDWPTPPEPKAPPAPAATRRPRIDTLAGLAAELSRPVPQPEPEAIPARPAAKVEPRLEPRLEPKIEPKIEPKAEPKAEPKIESKIESRPEPKIEHRIEAKFEPKFEHKIESRPETKLEPKPEPHAPAAAAKNADADQNLADMAQRLEAALRRPGGPLAAASAPSRPIADRPVPAADRSVAAGRPDVAKPEAAKPAKPDNAFSSLEEEMANLLGRPPQGKT